MGEARPEFISGSLTFTFRLWGSKLSERGFG